MSDYEKLSELYSQLISYLEIDPRALASSIENYNRIYKNYDRVYRNYDQIYKNLNDSLPGISKAAKEAARVMEFIASTELDLTTYEKISREYYEILTSITDYQVSIGTSVEPDLGVSETVIQDSISAAESVLPQVEEPLRENYTLSVDAVKGRDPGWWDNERIRAWIGILISLYMLILQLMPDPQLTEIIEQNNTIIEIQQEQLAEARESNEEQKKLIQKLADSICALTKELEESREASDGLSDGGEGVDNAVDGEAHPDATDGQDGDTEQQY